MDTKAKKKRKAERSLCWGAVFHFEILSVVIFLVKFFEYHSFSLNVPTTFHYTNVFCFDKRSHANAINFWNRESNYTSFAFLQAHFLFHSFVRNCLLNENYSKAWWMCVCSHILNVCVCFVFALLFTVRKREHMKIRYGFWLLV